MGFSRESLKTMPMTFGTGLACFLVLSNGAKVEILRSATFPESTMLMLLGAGLIVLASLVRRLYPLGGVVAPKSMQVILCISPAEIADHLAASEKR
jgi:hypothetical protein